MSKTVTLILVSSKSTGVIYLAVYYSPINETKRIL